MKMRFFWNRATRKFYLELNHGGAFVAGDLTPEEGVGVYNLILDELRVSASNPEALPKSLAVVDTPPGTPLMLNPVGGTPES